MLCCTPETKKNKSCKMNNSSSIQKVRGFLFEDFLRKNVCLSSRRSQNLNSAIFDIQRKMNKGFVSGGSALVSYSYPFALIDLKETSILLPIAKLHFLKNLILQFKNNIV